MDLPKEFIDKVSIVSLTRSSLDIINIEVEIVEHLSPQERSCLLLDLEDAMCELDSSVRIWHTPLGDKNTLRNLRGVNL